MPDSLYPPEKSSGIWVWLEHNGTDLESVSLELLAKGRELADAAGEKLIGLLMGHETNELAETAAVLGVDEIVICDHELLKLYTTDAYAQAAAAAILAEKPNVLLFGATPDGRDLAGRLAVRLRSGLTADCTELEMMAGEPCQLLGEVTGFGGGIAAMIGCKKHRPQMATVRPGVFLPARPGAKKAAIRRLKTAIDASKCRTRVLDRKIEDGIDITKADTLVCGGRGTKGNFKPLEELAKTLNADIGATRVACDQGWISYDHMVGQTGFMTRPKVAVVCGVSGALQFTVGIKDADKVVAINSDAAAPIFESSDYCVVGDIFKIIPPLIKELEKKK